MRTKGRWFAAIVAPALAAVIASSCHTATQITLHVTTNASCTETGSSDVFRELAVAAGSPGKVSEEAPAATSATCNLLEESLGVGFGPNDLGTLVIVPQGDKNMGIEVAVIANVRSVGNQTVELDACQTWAATGMAPAGFRDFNDHTTDTLPVVPCLLARRRLGFVPHFKLELPVQLDTQCTGVFCAPGSTCVNSTCVVDDTSCSESDPTCDLGSGGAGGAGTTTTSSTASAMTTSTASAGATTSASTTVSSGSGCTACPCQNPGEVCDSIACTCTCDNTQCGMECGAMGGMCKATGCTCNNCQGVCSTPCAMSGLVCNPGSCFCDCVLSACLTYCQMNGFATGMCGPNAAGPLPPINLGGTGMCTCM